MVRAVVGDAPSLRGVVDSSGCAVDESHRRGGARYNARLAELTWVAIRCLKHRTRTSLALHHVGLASWLTVDICQVHGCLNHN